MNPVIHLLHPVQSPGKWEKMRCGLTRDKDHDIYQTVVDPELVTCLKCKGFIANPWRSLRNYGTVTVIDNEAVAIIHKYSYQLDIIAVNEFNGKWTLVIADQQKNSVHTYLTVSSMKDLAEQILDFYENELIELAKID